MTLIQELEAWANTSVLWEKSSDIDWIRFDEILSRHKQEAATPQEGLREAIIEYLNPHHPPIGYQEYTHDEREYFKGVETVKDAIGHILRQHPAPKTQDESLAELADRKGRLTTYITHQLIGRKWEIRFCGVSPFLGDTYSEVESNARKYLDSLPDQQGKGER